MGKFWKYTLWNIAVIYVFCALLALPYGVLSLLLAPIVIAFFEVITALFLLIPKRTRNNAQIMLMASGIILLIGFGVCSMFPIKI